MPNKKKTGRCECRQNSRKAYKEIVKTRRQIVHNVLPSLRKVLHLTVEIDKATGIIATELRKQQLDENGG